MLDDAAERYLGHVGDSDQIENPRRHEPRHRLVDADETLGELPRAPEGDDVLAGEDERLDQDEPERCRRDKHRRGQDRHRPQDVVDPGKRKYEDPARKQQGGLAPMPNCTHDRDRDHSRGDNRHHMVVLRRRDKHAHRRHHDEERHRQRQDFTGARAGAPRVLRHKRVDEAQYE